MLPRSLSLLFSLGVVVASPRVALADEPEPAPVAQGGEAELPAPEPGSAAVLPTDAPTQVAPPSSDPEAPPPHHKGTTSSPHLEHKGGHGPSGLTLHEGPLEVRPGGFLQLESYLFAGPGVADYQRADGTGLKAGVAIHRARFELAGRLLHRWFFQLQAEYGPDKRFLPTNNFVGLDAHPYLKLQVGQFRVPFTMENQVDPRFLGFMERSMTARLVGAPSVKDLGIMAWGGREHGPLTWALGWFGGEGSNRPSADNRGDLIGRLVLRPLYRLPGSLRDAHLGVSGRFGRRDRNYVLSPTGALRTPGGYELWSPTYGTTEVRPSSEQRALGLELFLPWRRFDLRAEAVLVHDERREVDTKVAAFNNTERSGTLTGHTWYVEVAYWIFGQPRFGGNPGHYAPPRGEPHTTRSLSIAARFERLRLDYDSVARSFDDAGALIPGVKRGALDATTTSLSVDAAQVSLSYYATRHLRLLAQWSGYFFENDQVVAPGAKANGNDPEAKVLHEVSLRVQLSI
ncbi:MAG: hypothetical protein JNL79_17740 [Myxococcales bacterium]|nr:hypothetical protein [Myxococcales bacterium]